MLPFRGITLQAAGRLRSVANSRTSLPHVLPSINRWTSLQSCSSGRRASTLVEPVSTNSGFTSGPRNSSYTDDQIRMAWDTRNALLLVLALGDIAKVAPLWTQLVDARVVGLLDIDFWTFCSKRIAGLNGNTLEEPLIDVLDSLVVHAAAAGRYEGLCARMRFYISDENPHNAVNLFKRALELGQQRNMLTDGGPASSPAKDQELRPPGKRRTPPLDPLLVGHAITALALKAESFQEGLRIFTHPSIPPGAAMALAPELLRPSLAVSTERAPLREKALLYGSKLRLATILHSHSEELRNSLTTLFLTGSPEAPHVLLRDLLDQLSDLPRSFIATDPAALSDDRPILMEQHSDKWAAITRAAIHHGYHKYARQLQGALKMIFGGVPPQVDAAKLGELAVMKNFTEAHMSWKALRISMQAEPDRFPRADVCRAYISALFDKGREKDALDVFDQFRRSIHKSVANAVPADATEEESNLELYHTVQASLLQRSKLLEAQDILQDMIRRGPHPSTASYNIFLRHFAAAGQVDQLESTFDRLQKDGPAPNLESYCWLAVGLRTQSEGIRKVFDRIAQEGILEASGTTGAEMIRFLSAKDKNEEGFATACMILDFLDAHTSPSMQPTDAGILDILCAIERRVWVSPGMEAAFRKAITEVAERHRFDFRGKPAHTAEVMRACLEKPTRSAADRAWRYYRTYTGPVPRDRFLEVPPLEEIWVEYLDGLRARKEWVLADIFLKELEFWADEGLVFPLALQLSVKLVRERCSIDVALFAEGHNDGKENTQVPG